MIIETSRLRLAVERRGSGEPVVLLHSLAMAGAMWEHVAERLAKRFEVWTYDARGHGQSPWDNEPFTIEDLAEDLRDLLDALGLDRAHIVGLSMGGTTAIVFAATYPERVNRLVLVDCSACYGPTRVSDWEARASKVLSSPREALLDFQLDRWFTPHFRATNPEEVRRQVEIFLACSSHVHAAASRALAAVDAEALLPRITASTLVLVGEDDYATPPAMAQTLAAGIPDAYLQIVPQARHMALIERPELVEAIAQHLQGAHSTVSPGSGHLHGWIEDNWHDS